MGIKKQEFYEGAALHILVRSGKITSIRHEAPFFLLNDRLLVYLKYSTKNRSPWGFTFTREEQELLQKRSLQYKIIIGLICGADGVATLPYDAYRSLSASKSSAVHISCFRKHGERYEVNGPDGTLKGKIAPLNWQGLFNIRGNDEA